MNFREKILLFTLFTLFAAFPLSCETFVYIAEHYDTLESLARRFHVPSKVISEINSLQSDIKGGQKLNIPLRNTQLPLTVSKEVLLNYNRQNWRQASWELFSWKKYPEILILDTASYSVQSAMLKRICFFAERKGFSGKLLTDRELKEYKDWNAHDYNASTLARFYTKAENKRFSLNKPELILRELLLKNRIIIRARGGYRTGKGVLLSISRSMNSYWRERVLKHELIHGLYFISAPFRSRCRSVWFSQSKEERTLWKTYLSLKGYDEKNSQLCISEFTAYLLQNSDDELEDFIEKNFFTAITYVYPGKKASIIQYKKSQRKPFLKEYKMLRKSLLAVFSASPL